MNKTEIGLEVPFSSKKEIAGSTKKERIKEKRIKTKMSFTK
jgi:hypothetical protein